MDSRLLIVVDLPNLLEFKIILWEPEINMVAAVEQLITDTWIIATWDEYIKNIEHPTGEKVKGYYHNGQYRIEITPISNEHSQDHCIINHAVYLYATLRGIPLTGKDNCSYRQAGLRQFQPDLSYYLKDKASAVPWG